MYSKKTQSWLKHLDFLILDLVCLHVSFVLAYMIRNGLQSPYLNHSYFNISVVFTLITALVSVFFESYKNILKRNSYKEFTAALRHVCMVELFSALYLFSVQSAGDYSRIVFYLTGVIYAVLTYVMRILWKKRLQSRMEDSGKRSLLIITSERIVEQVVINVKNHNYEMFRFAGIAVIDRDMKGKSFDGIEVVANRENVADYICREWIDEVFFNLPDEVPYPTGLINQITEMGVIVHVKLLRQASLLGNMQLVERLGNYTVLTTSINVTTPGQLFMKRALDIAGGLVGCLITAILVILIGPAIYIQSPGPIFFSQTRMGKNGKKFKMYKFRSMYMDAEERKKELMKENRVKDGMMFKLDWDPRIIGSKKLPDGSTKKGIGNYIRDLSLDEFPQFFNVLKGDMSLVGTRPPTVDEWEKYELHHRARLATKPGVTGMWQVSGRSNITDFEEVVKLDTKYISEWSIELDIKILFKTIAVVFKKDGAM